jgi:hypothetical protein
MKHYTFNVVCSFTMQFTFTEYEVQPGSDGSESDVVPLDSELTKIEVELRNLLSQHYSVGEVDLYAGSDALLGIENDSIS